MAYIDCPECGQRALSVATRCPRCSHSFIQDRALDPEDTPEPKRHPVALAVGAVLVLALVSVMLRESGSRSGTPTGNLAMDPPPADSAIVIVPDSVDLAGREVADSGEVDSVVQARSDSVLLVTAQALVAAPPPTAVEEIAPSRPAAAVTAALATPGGALRQRWSSTWVNVRAERSGGSPSVTVLNPGQAVQVDSLSRGWYRVWLDGSPIGFVDRSFLDSIAPEPS